LKKQQCLIFGQNKRKQEEEHKLKQHNEQDLLQKWNSLPTRLLLYWFGDHAFFRLTFEEIGSVQLVDCVQVLRQVHEII
jgi:hypothetical protein